MVQRLVQRTFTTETGPDATWDHLAAVERWPSWARHIRRVVCDPPGPLGPATRGRIVLRPGAWSTFTMTRLDAPRSWSWRGRFLGTVLDYDHVVEPLPTGGARVTLTIEGHGPTARVVGPIFGAIYGRILDRAIPHLVNELSALAH